MDEMQARLFTDSCYTKWVVVVVLMMVFHDMRRAEYVANMWIGGLVDQSEAKPHQSSDLILNLSIFQSMST